MLREQGAEGVHDLAALWGRRRAPRWECVLSGAYGGRDVRCVRRGEIADQVACVSRVARLEGAAALGRAPLPTDEVAEGWDDTVARQGGWLVRALGHGAIVGATAP